MKKSIVIFVILLFASTSFAGNLSYRDKRKLRKEGYSNSDVRAMERGSEKVEPTYKYKSSTGNRYKYDLSKPGDKIRYETDPGAQLRDSIYMPINPSTDIDRGLGQYGGGLDTD